MKLIVSACKNRELWLSTLICVCLFVSVPVLRGGFGMSWDTQNHHIYLGWVATQARFEQDYFAASTQSYQFPYLYWPVYQMTKWRLLGWQAGVIWALMHSLVAIPLWVMAKALIPSPGKEAAVYRLAAVLLGVFNILVLRAPETPVNDVLAAIPYVWAVAIGLWGIRDGTDGSVSSASLSLVACMGGLGGLSVALKLSNGVLVLMLPFMCMAFNGSVRQKIWAFFACVLSASLVFAVVYGWWGWQLWVHFGNPVFPFYDAAFEPLRNWLDWRPHGVVR